MWLQEQKRMQKGVKTYSYTERDHLNQTLFKIELKGIHSSGSTWSVSKNKKLIMKEVLEENNDRKATKIIEVYNQKV